MNLNRNDGDRGSQGRKSQRHLLALQNIRAARRKWAISPDQVALLKSLTEELELSVAGGHLARIDGNWYVTNAGLLRVARRNHCAGILVERVRDFCDPSLGRWVFKATIYKSPSSRGFVGYGDADPSNVSPLVRGAEMRVAETRAVNRALRKAYGIGLCSVEELGWTPCDPEAKHTDRFPAPPSSNGHNNGHSNGQPRLRDRLCLLMRQHRLDASLVRSYAADFCGTPILHDASREQIEAFVNHLADWASRDRNALLCKLNSYSPTQKVTE